MIRYLDDILMSLNKAGKTLATKGKTLKPTQVFSNPSAMTNPNIDDVVLSTVAQARKNAQQIYNMDKRLHSYGILEAIEHFKKANNCDYELLAKILQNQDLVTSGFVHSVLKNTNPNNRAIVELFLDSPELLFGKNVKSKLMSLNVFMCLNRNNPIAKEFLTDKKIQEVFWDKALLAIKTGSKGKQKLGQSSDVIGYGGRVSKDKLNIATLSKNYLDDLENLAHGRDYIQHYDVYLDAIRNTKYGEAFSLKGKMFVREADGKFTELGYSEDVFRKLFPPVDRFNMCQGALGDCYFVSLMDAIMNKPEGRNRIYKMFKGSTTNQIVVSKGDKFKPFLFQRLDNEGLHVHNENAFAILEQFAAYNKAGNMSLTPEVVMRKFRGGTSLTSGRLLFDMGGERFVNEFAFNERIIERLIKSGLSKDEAIKQSKKEFIKMLENNINKPDKVITFGTIPKPNSSSESLLNDVYDLYSQHGYSIKAYNPNIKTVTISNPWNTAIETEIPIDELIKYVNKEGFCCTDISLPT